MPVVTAGKMAEELVTLKKTNAAAVPKLVYITVFMVYTWCDVRAGGRRREPERAKS